MKMNGGDWRFSAINIEKSWPLQLTFLTDGMIISMKNVCREFTVAHLIFYFCLLCATPVLFVLRCNDTFWDDGKN